MLQTLRTTLQTMKISGEKTEISLCTTRFHGSIHSIILLLLYHFHCFLKQLTEHLSFLSNCHFGTAGYHSRGITSEFIAHILWWNDDKIKNLNKSSWKIIQKREPTNLCIHFKFRLIYSSFKWARSVHSFHAFQFGTVF